MKAAAKKKPSVTRAEQRRKLFMKRSYTIYRHMLERLKKSLPQDPPRLREQARLPFTLLLFREWLGHALVDLCPYCKEAITPKTMSADHRVPVSRGGEWGVENLEVTCASCNGAKGELTAKEFRRIAKVARTWEPTVMRRFFGRLKAGASISRLRFLGRRKTP